MHRSTDRFLTTHTGSLPRPRAVEDTVTDTEATDAERQEVLSYVLSGNPAHNMVVRQQLDTGLDIISDGEQDRQSYLGAVTTGWRGAVAIRDSKDPAGAKLVISGPQWKAFLNSVITGGTPDGC